MNERTRLYTDERMQLHEMGPQHPERPARLTAIVEALNREPVAGSAWAQRIEPAAEAVPERVHDAAYVAEVRDLRGMRLPLDADTSVNEHSVDCAYLAVGACLQAVDDVLAGAVRSAFVFPRPPGHHAERARAMGFCLFGNVALAADHAIRTHGLERVMVLDWDVHHGNGTEDLCAERRDILFVDLHQFPLYPGTGRAEDVGRGEGVGYTVNIPLPPGCGDAEYLAAFERVVEPVARQFAPQLLLVSAGFDAHERDPLAQQRITTQGFARFAATARRLAEELCEGRLVLVLEGGYDLTALAESARACVEVLAAKTAPQPPSNHDLPAPAADALAHLDKTIRAQSSHGPWTFA